jgi:hypothetical protein
MRERAMAAGGALALALVSCCAWRLTSKGFDDAL